ncbi:MAG: helix-turn-helix domain-containing protein [Egibacteraceae bacterium]
MIHRHVEYPPETPVTELPSAAIVDLLDRGDLDDWRPIAQAVARDPHGPFTQRVARLLDAYPMYGTSPLWRAWIERCQARAREAPTPMGLAEVRHRAGLSQAELAARMGISQSDLSKLERRQDMRVSTLRAYAEALGADLHLRLTTASDEIDAQIGGDA